MRSDRKGFDGASRRALERDPRSVMLHTTLAEVASRTGGTTMPCDFARARSAQDSIVAGAQGPRAERAARRADRSARVRLERAFALDPYHLWIKNTLDLLDTVRRVSRDDGRLVSSDHRAAGGRAPDPVSRRAARRRLRVALGAVSATSRRPRFGSRCIAVTATSRCAPWVCPGSVRSA